MTTDSNAKITNANTMITDSNAKTTDSKVKTTDSKAMITDSNTMTTDSNTMTTDSNTMTTDSNQNSNFLPKILLNLTKNTAQKCSKIGFRNIFLIKIREQNHQFFVNFKFFFKKNEEKYMNFIIFLKIFVISKYNIFWHFFGLSKNS